MRKVQGAQMLIIELRNAYVMSKQKYIKYMLKCKLKFYTFMLH